MPRTPDPRGLKVVRYKGNFYTEPLYQNSCPSSSDWIVANVPTDHGDLYAKWLVSQRVRYQEIADAYVEMIPSAISAEWFPSTILHVLSVPLKAGIPHNPTTPRLLNLPSTRLPLKVNPAVWIYTIDLDQEIFSINHHFHFPLFAIPPNWWLKLEPLPQPEHQNPNETTQREYLRGVDDSTRGLVALSRESKNPSLSPALTRGILQWSLVNPKPLSAFPIGKRYQVRFANRLYLAMTDTRIESIRLRWNYMSLQSSTHAGSRESIFAILCLASTDPDYYEFVLAGGGPGAYGNGISGGYGDEHIDVGRLNASSGLDSDRNPLRTYEMVRRLGSETQNESTSAHIAPESSIYWFNNALVCLWDRLEDDVEAQTSIKYVSEVALSGGIDCFYAIIISTTHVILLQMLPGRHLRRTMRLRLVDLDQELGSLPKEPSTARISKKMKDSPLDRSAFAAIAHLLEAAQRQKLAFKSTKPALPYELILKIVKYSDRKTRMSLAKVNRMLRDACQGYNQVADKDDIFDTGKYCFLGNDNKRNFRHLQQGPLALWNLKKWHRRRPDFSETLYLPIVGHRSITRSFIPEAAVTFSMVSLSKPRDLDEG